MWFSTKIKAVKVQENGLEKTVTEQYLVDAVSWGEAESRTIEEVSCYYTSEFAISDIRPYKVAEIVSSEDDADDKYFLCKLCFMTLDENSGIEKKAFSNILVQSSDIHKAQESLKAFMSHTMAPYNIDAVKETNILDVYKYEHKEKEEDEDEED